MKKLISLFSLLFLAAIVLISCRKDDEVSQPTLAGTWQPTSIKATGVVNGQQVSQTINANNCQLQSRVIFNADGTGITRNWNDQSGTCTQQADSNFTYSYNAQTKALTITSGNSSTVGTVSSLTHSQLVYSMNSTYDFNGNNVPAVLEVTANRAQ